MAYRRLFIFLEGDDDERFFDRFIKPMYERIYNCVELVKYSEMKKQKVNNFLQSIKAMRAEYLFVSDLDESPCVTAKKERIASEFAKLSEDQRILIVCKEIESWYLAGLNDEGCRQIGIPPSYNTDRISKEQFNGMMPRKFDSRIDFMQEIHTTGKKLKDLCNRKKKS